MDHRIGIDGRETRETPNERLEALKEKNLPTPDNQQSLGDGDVNKIMGLDLYEATKKGDVEKFIEAIEKVSESRKLALSLIFDQVTPAENSLLHVAASSGSEDVVELILIHYPHLVSKRNSSEDTPLHVAVQEIRTNERNSSEDTPHRVIDQERRTSAINKLISFNSKIMYLKNKDNKSPLYLAVENCAISGCYNREEACWKIFWLLLEACAQDKDYARKIEGMSPVLAAILGSDSDTLEEIPDQLPKLPHVRGEDVGTRLLSAASVGDTEVVQLPQESDLDMLKEIIDKLPELLHVRDEEEGTPLHSAARVENVRAVQLLLSKCHELALQKDKNGSYPIHIACEGNNIDIIRELANMWPDLAEIKNKKGQNILHVAAERGNTSAVRHILKECDNEKLVNSKDVDGNTPLHLASMQNHCDVLLCLLSVEGSYWQLWNNHNLTARDVAMKFESSSTKYPALLGSMILMAAGIPRAKDPDVWSPREQSSGAEESSPIKKIKKEISTRLIVATLVASVTFSAGMVLPGGYNGSSDPNPGLATLMYNRGFQIFVILDAVATYCSIVSVVLLLWAHNADFSTAQLFFYISGPLLSWAVYLMTL